ncbi:MAG TPA: hypothetical protein VFO63_21880 [Blastocatellia bacterium]|nr:hypothetical protein [Blastocatellia bacterium]
MILRQTDSPHRRLTVPDHKEVGFRCKRVFTQGRESVDS